MTEDWRLALWAVDLTPRFADLAAWLAHVDECAGVAAGAEARLLVMPEYACEAWLGFKPAGLAPTAEIAWLAGIAGEALPHLRAIAGCRRLALLPGTMPWQVGGSFRNRAWLIAPDGRLVAQDKLSLTPGERDPESWSLAPGDALHVVELDGIRLAVLVCLDVEMPALSVRMAELDLDLVLVPSMTGSAAGHARVFGCARARAVELMCAVACTGVVGAAPGTTQNPANVSGNAVFVPCEPALGYTCVLLSTPASGSEGRLDIVDLPIGVIRAVRTEGGEVWPGAWSAGHVLIVEGWPG